MRNIKLTLSSDGVGFCVHAKKKASLEYVIQFMLNYTEQHGLCFHAGRVPGYSRDDMKLLPSSVS